MLEFDTHIDKLDYLLGVNYLFIPAKIVQDLGGLKCGRLVCKVNNSIEFQCGLMSLSKGDAYITINKARMNKLKVQTGSEVHVSLKKDESEYGMDICEELQELLDQDTEGKARFDALSPGMQRYIIFYVAQVKSSQKRIERAVLLIGNLKLQTEGKESFRAMLGKE